MMRSMLRRLWLAAMLVVAVSAEFGLMNKTQVQAQAQTSATVDISGTWQGTTVTPEGKSLREVVKISKAEGTGWKSVLYSIDMAPRPIPVDSTTLEGRAIKFSIKGIDLVYDGTLNEDGKTIAGKFVEFGHNYPLNLALTSAEDAWAIPEPPKPMAEDAKPTFDVVTIKPGDPNRQGINIGFQGRHFRAINFTVDNLIALSYGLHANQIIGAPKWLSTERFDIDGVPDVEGIPNQIQQHEMVQQLLADRFKLVIHHEKQELPVYAITVAKGGPKLTKSTMGPNDPFGFGFRKLGSLTVKNMTIADFAIWFQGSVTDKPMVDQTGLTDRYDFTLSWTPDDSQFAQFRGTGMKIPAATDDLNAPPGLYTAITEQLGLKIEPVKAMDDVIVIDHVEHPSAN